MTKRMIQDKWKYGYGMTERYSMTSLKDEAERYTSMKMKRLKDIKREGER